ncbi:PREDICTED: hydrocephalus-inducing protein-like [Nicrophorus vespilloides]|uniref:Hydrocephalus-inducing protein-like n=1 Tax=Nicrophorus vespilloides TaxID=110193 RepID=A0ABM1M5G5_NICVS|nr:PREDICTED: hydrocephalus-inducing protein-like [Nicrophorus vespilloides]
MCRSKSVSKPLRIASAESGYFSVKHTSEAVSTKIAPGMSYQLQIDFTAEELRDYSHKIVFLTDGESLELDVLAIGPRPLLDIPDRVTLPTGAVNIQTERTLLVRNLGSIPATYVARTWSPFSLKPDRGIINPNELFQLSVYFKPQRIGLNSQTLLISLETGEQLTVELEGDGEEVDVCLGGNRIEFKPTFLGLTTQVNYEVKNRSGFCVDFKWKPEGNAEKELKRERQLKDKFGEMGLYEISRDNVLSHNHIADREMNRAIYDRILQDETEDLDIDEEILFHDANIIIDPLAGELWPRSKIVFPIIFAPKAVGSYETITYLQLTGRMQRIPIKLVGCCVGPSININVEDIDAQNIYVRAVHMYELIFSNQGPIPGTVRYIPTETQFGGEFSTTTDNFEVFPNSKLNMSIIFSSETRGRFIEDVCFEIVESKKILKFNFSGNIVCPLLNFDVQEIDLGEIPIGIPSFNMSTPICCFIFAIFGLRLSHYPEIPEDGNEPSYTLEEYSEMSPKEEVNSSPREFTCVPRKGLVEAYTRIPVALTVVANKLGSLFANLTLTMWGSPQNNRSINLKYHSCTPKIICNIPKIDLKSIFITEPYMKTVVLQNTSIYPGYLQITNDGDEDLEISTDITEAYVEPESLLEINVTVKTEIIGYFNGFLRVNIFGAESAEQVCEINVNSRGPCIDLNMDSMNLGKIPTLTTIKREILVTNDSPIPAHLTFRVIGEFLTVKENDMHLPPESSKTMYLEVFGNYPGKFKNILRLQVEKGDTDVYEVVGECEGGSILCDPLLDPEFAIGTVFTKHKFSMTLTMVNKGKQMHHLCWTQITKLRSFKFEEPPGIFKFIPQQCDLMPGQTITIIIEASSEKPREVDEVFRLFAKLDRDSQIRNILTSRISAFFQDPEIHFSKNMLLFRMDVSQEETTAVLEDDLTLTNCTDIEIIFTISIESPFQLLHEDEVLEKLSTSLSPSGSVTFYVCFDPPQRDRRCFTENGLITIIYQNHPKIDKIMLSGTVNYPNIEFMPSEVNFEYVPSEWPSYRIIYMKNKSPLPVFYEWGWIEQAFYVEDVDFVTTPSISKEVCETNDDHVVELDVDEEEEIDAIDEFAVKNILYPLLENYTLQESKADTDLYRAIQEYQCVDELYEMLDMIPSKGMLAPYEVQYISVQIKPPALTTVNAAAMCFVEGGEIEVLKIKATASEINYKLDNMTVDFGIIGINNVSTKQCPLHNTGYTPLQFNVCYRETSSEFKPIPRWMQVEPLQGTVPAGDTVHFKVTYFPGIVGLFTEYIELEIGFQAVVMLTVKGCAVHPQVYFNLPRPEFQSDYVNELSYQAISELLYSEHLNVKPKQQDRVEGFEGDWEIIYYEAKMPTMIDICMAIERQLCMEHLLFKPNLIQDYYYNKNPTIPGLLLPSYTVDFGYVVVDSAVDIHLDPIKYNPFYSRVIWHKGFSVNGNKDVGLSLVFERNKVGPFLVFKPNKKIFVTLDHTVEAILTASIIDGPKLEFKIKAIVTLPKITFLNSFIDFGKVRCGNCLKKSVIVTNSGNVSCKWTVSIFCPQKKDMRLFFTYNTEGNLEVGKSQLLELYFQPKFHGKVEWKLVINIEENPDVVTIPLKGYGLQTELVIIEDHLVYEPSLPYCPDNIKSFTITNNSAFPVEFFFSDFDDLVDFEDDVIYTLLLFYGVSRLYVQPRSVGDSLPESMIKTYYEVMGSLRNFLKLQIKEEIMREQAIQLSESREGEFEGSLYSVDMDDIMDPLEGKSRDDIRCLLKENIANLHNTKSTITATVTKSIYEIEDNSNVENIDPAYFREGILLIFHGAPQTGFNSFPSSPKVPKT